MNSKKSDIVRSMISPETSEALIYQCRIHRIYPETLSADIYIPQINRAYYGVYIGEGVISTYYRSGGLPDTSSEGLVCLYSKSGMPVIIAFIPPSSFNKGEQKFEYINEGEYQNMSAGGAFAKFSAYGTTHVGSGKFSSQVFSSDGKTINYNLGSADILNLAKKELITEPKDDIISIYGRSELCEKSAIRVYPVDEIKADLEEKEKQIVNEAKDFINDLFGISGVFDSLSSLIKSAIAANNFDYEFSAYKEKSKAIKVASSGIKINSELFGDSLAKMNVCDENGNIISGIEFNKNGAKLVGSWNVELTE